MGFGRLVLGFTTGIALPYMVHDNLYYAIATCFYLPHLTFAKKKAKLAKQQAIPLELLDSYLKDVGKSFLLFWLLLGPTLYKTYYTKENILDALDNVEGFETSSEKEQAHEKKDAFTELLSKVKQAEAGGKKKKMARIISAEDKTADAGAEADQTEAKQERLSFEDYEKLMKRLEREQNWEQI